MSKANFKILTGQAGTEVLVSYSTPVAIKDEEGRIYVTDEFHSVTTSKHINKYVAGRYSEKVKPVIIQNFLANLCSGVHSSTKEIVNCASCGAMLDIIGDDETFMRPSVKLH